VKKKNKKLHQTLDLLRPTSYYLFQMSELEQTRQYLKNAQAEKPTDKGAADFINSMIEFYIEEITRLKEVENK
jgi:hypothetical protein